MILRETWFSRRLIDSKSQELFNLTSQDPVLTSLESTNGTMVVSTEEVGTRKASTEKEPTYGVMDACILEIGWTIICMDRVNSAGRTVGGTKAPIRWTKDTDSEDISGTMALFTKVNGCKENIMEGASFINQASSLKSGSGVMANSSCQSPSSKLIKH